MFAYIYYYYVKCICNKTFLLHSIRYDYLAWLYVQHQ